MERRCAVLRMPIRRSALPATGDRAGEVRRAGKRWARAGDEVLIQIGDPQRRGHAGRGWCRDSCHASGSDVHFSPRKTILPHLEGTSRRHGTVPRHHGIVATRHATVQTHHGFVQTHHGFVQTRHGFVQTRHGFVQTRHGFVQTRHGFVQTRHGFVQTRFRIHLSAILQDRQPERRSATEPFIRFEMLRDEGVRREACAFLQYPASRR